MAGGYYSLESAQFSELRKRDFSQLDRLWKQAENPESLLATERRLKWGKAEEGAAPATPSHGVDDAQPDDAGVDPDLAPDRPGSFSKVAWSALKAVAGLPTRTLSFIVNLGPVPQDNLKVSKPRSAFCAQEADHSLQRLARSARKDSSAHSSACCDSQRPEGCSCDSAVRYKSLSM